MVAHDHNPSNWNAEAAGSLIWSQSQPQSKLQASLNYMKNLYYEKKKKEEEEEEQQKKRRRRGM
jgi:hypothetical protein